jgi:hypothetical protein
MWSWRRGTVGRTGALALAGSRQEDHTPSPLFSPGSIRPPHRPARRPDQYCYLQQLPAARPSAAKPSSATSPASAKERGSKETATNIARLITRPVRWGSERSCSREMLTSRGNPLRCRSRARAPGVLAAGDLRRNPRRPRLRARHREGDEGSEGAGTAEPALRQGSSADVEGADHRDVDPGQDQEQSPDHRVSHAYRTPSMSSATAPPSRPSSTPIPLSSTATPGQRFAACVIVMNDGCFLHYML